MSFFFLIVRRVQILIEKIGRRKFNFIPISHRCLHTYVNDDDNAGDDVDAEEEDEVEDVEETERMREIDRVQILQSRLPYLRKSILSFAYSICGEYVCACNKLKYIVYHCW